MARDNLRDSMREARREQAKERTRQHEQRMRAIERMHRSRERTRTDESIKRHNAIVTGLVPRIAGAIDSWANKRVPLTVRHPAGQFSAWTDFASITLNIPEVKDVGVDFAADLRGLAYHEAGHVLMSTPFMEMLNHVMPLGEPEYGNRAPEHLRNEWLQKMGLPLALLHRAWNMLEDQRMETAMARESVNLGRYYNVIVLTHVLQGGASTNAHLLLYGRHHVDADVRRAARANYVQAHGLDDTAYAESMIDDYKASKDLTEMWYLTCHFAYLVQALNDEGLTSVDEHGMGEPCTDGQPGDGQPGKGGDKLDRSASEPKGDKGESKDDESEDEDGSGGVGNGDDDDDDEGNGGGGSGEGDDDEADDGPSNGPSVADRRSEGAPAQDDGDGMGADESMSDPDWDREMVSKALDEARQERNHDGTVTNDVKAYNEALAQTRDSINAERIPLTVNPDPQANFQAAALNRALRNIMEQARAEKAPSWQTGQRRGVLNVMRYKTRQPGDMEFFTDYAEGGDMRLPNMAVSVLLDGSGSMNHRNGELAIAAFGMKSACDVVGIPCTVTVFDTAPYLLWDQHDRPLDVPMNVVPGGGTDPASTLDLVDLQKADKDNHLVIIMTDGEWMGGWRDSKSLENYASPDRDIAIFFYKMPVAHNLRGLGTCSTAERIDSLSELPRFLNRYILRAL